MSNTATVSYAWSKKGVRPQVVCKQRKRERQTVFGGYNYGTGQITVSFADKGNSCAFKKHLKKALQVYKTAPKVIVVLDNVAYHHAKRISAWTARNPKPELFFLPPYGPGLNAVERALVVYEKKNSTQQVHQNAQRKKNSFLENVFSFPKAK